MDLRAGAIAAACAVAAIAGCGSSAGGPGPGGAGRLGPPSNVHTEPAVPLHCVLAWTPPAQPVDGYEIATSLAGWTFADATPGSVAPGTATRAELDFSHTSPFLGFDAAGKLFTLADPTAATDGSSTTAAYRLSREP